MPLAEQAILEFDDAILLARACHDFNDGLTGNEWEAFHRGISTVIAVLEAAKWRIGFQDKGRD